MLLHDLFFPFLLFYRPFSELLNPSGFFGAYPSPSGHAALVLAAECTGGTALEPVVNVDG